MERMDSNESKGWQTRRSHLPCLRICFSSSCVNLIVDLGSIAEESPTYSGCQRSQTYPLSLGLSDAVIVMFVSKRVQGHKPVLGFRSWEALVHRQPPYPFEPLHHGLSGFLLLQRELRSPAASENIPEPTKPQTA
jgi:hypothetical protein